MKDPTVIFHHIKKAKIKHKRPNLQHPHQDSLVTMTVYFIIFTKQQYLVSVTAVIYQNTCFSSPHATATPLYREETYRYFTGIAVFNYDFICGM